MDDLKRAKIKSMFPQGVNTVDHSARIKLGLTCEEYCVFETILSRKKKGKQTIFEDIEEYTGLLPKTINEAIFTMSHATLLQIKDEFFYLNKGMVDKAFKEKNDMLKEEFELFWKEEIIKDGVPKMQNAWPGPREQAEKNFFTARAKYSFEFIMKQRKDYFQLLQDHQTWRVRMQATKFLNIKSGQLTEDFYSQIPLNARKEQVNQKISIKEKENLYN